MNKDMNNIGIRHDRPMTYQEIETAAMNMRAVERSLDWEPATTPVGKFLDGLWNVIWGIVIVLIIFSAIFM